MNWTRRYSLIAGVALIVLTNAIALLGVLYNHSGTPDSVLKLSQRELQIPFGWTVNNENSGLSLRLLWRMPVYGNGPAGPIIYGENYPHWLDREKLASLGFDVTGVASSIDADRASAKYRKQLSKQVFLVLEFDGPAYQQALEVARKMEAEEIKKSQSTTLAREQNVSSRLFVVDAGLDRELLRAQYPDTHHYSIVRGQVRPTVSYADKPPMMSGYVSNISAENINVPLEFRGKLEPMQKNIQRSAYSDGNGNLAPFEATIAFGKRLEPWIETTSVK